MLRLKLLNETKKVQELLSIGNIPFNYIKVNQKETIEFFSNININI